MHELQLVSVGDVLIGGTTKPVNIIALNENGAPCKYILKLFTKRQILQGISVAKEIISSELAKQFNLICPDYGVINFEHSEIDNLYGKERFYSLDEGYKFCSKFIEQSVIFTPLVTKNFLNDYDYANIFAFDFFVYNIDRGGVRKKPNLLINDSDLILIDHELTFSFIDSDKKVDYESYLRNYPYQHHILIKYLKSSRQKKHLFDEFLEMLKVLNLSSLNSTFDALERLQIPHYKRERFINYFMWTKQNVTIFERYLKTMIQ